jgi:hypothetical protein
MELAAPGNYTAQPDSVSKNLSAFERYASRCEQRKQVRRVSELSGGI